MRTIITIGFLAIAAAACGGDSSEPPETVTVSMTDFAFSPTPLTIDRGTTVQWRNNGAVQHNSTGPSNAWSSGNINAGQSFSREFNTAGTFDYTCTLHLGMNGRVVVQ